MSAVAACQPTIALSSDVPFSPPVPRGETLHVDVCKRYRERENARFQLAAKFQVLPGISILLGHSGAGKTTLLRSIAGLCHPDEGHISIGGRTLFDSARGICLGPAERKVGVVFQDLALFPHLTVEDNLAYGLRHIDKPERQQRIAAIAESFGIAHLRKRFPRQISGGEQQRVALARSLVAQPAALLLDEPLSSLDVETKSRIIEDLRAFNETRRIPMLYVTHDHSEAFALGQRVFALEKGQIVRQGSPLEVLSTPHRETIAEATGFENLFEATVIAIQEQERVVTCRLRGTAIELNIPQTRVTLGAEVRVGIRADEILLASARPEIVGACNVIRGRMKQIDTLATGLEGRVSCGVDFRVHLTQCTTESFGLQPSAATWMLIKPHSCHLVRKGLPSVLQRLFVFVCNGNVSRSPIAQAICNAEIARRLKVPFEALATAGVQAVSAGLSANPGESLSREAHAALEQIGISNFDHKSQLLTAELADRAELIFCMTEEQQHRALQMFPSAADKIQCLNPDVNLGAPDGHGFEALTALTQQIQNFVHERLDLLVGATQL